MVWHRRNGDSQPTLQARLPRGQARLHPSHNSKTRMSRIKRLRAALTDFPPVDPPSLWLMAFEQRALGEFWAGLALLPLLRQLAPRGDGHPVLVIPGLGASDLSTSLLRRFLDGLGYATYPWGLGRNRGMHDQRIDQMRARLEQIHSESKCKVSLVGQSLGGVYAREMARAMPQRVRQVITLGSPFAGHPLASTGIHLYEWLSGERMEDLDYGRHLKMRPTPPVPTTSIYSKLDGVVAWQCSIEDGPGDAESINLRGHSHTGMASAPLALYLIAQRLGQAASDWKPYVPQGAARVFFGTQDHHQQSA